MPSRHHRHALILNVLMSRSAIKGSLPLGFVIREGWGLWGGPGLAEDPLFSAAAASRTLILSFEVCSRHSSLSRRRVSENSDCL